MPVTDAKRKVSNGDLTLEHKRTRVEADNQLDALKTVTSVVADTGDFDKITQYKPDDATTNPSLLYQACQLPTYSAVVKNAVEAAKATGLTGETLVDEALDQLAVHFGVEILKTVSGYVSTEVDASLSFDTDASIEKARKLIAMYETHGFGKDRVLIKLGSTWESIEACRQLESEGIHCNMTLLFSFCQAVACAEAGATLISPFVGRILDWYKKATGTDSYSREKDPGVLSVRRIYRYFKKYGYSTIVMGASFRNTEEILGLVGCDKLTIAPKLLQELTEAKGGVEVALTAESAVSECSDVKRDPTTVCRFRWELNEDQMATEKLSEGIRNFNKDLEKLKDIVRPMLL